MTMKSMLQLVPIRAYLSNHKSSLLLLGNFRGLDTRPYAMGESDAPRLDHFQGQ
jgi:hypothetical protein